jgi:hypothetical protein
VLLAWCLDGAVTQIKSRTDHAGETKHVTARLIDQAAHEFGSGYIIDLMQERVREFNQMTEEELGG